VLNSPCNPTGAVYTRAELSALGDALRDTNVLVVSDEIYHRLVFGDDPFTSVAAVDGMLERTISVNGMSKSFAMTGWRLGFAAGPETVISAMARVQGQTTTGPASFIQTAAAAGLRGDQQEVEAMRRAYQRRGERMHAALNEMPGVRCPKPEGAFYCFPDVSATFDRLGVCDADEFVDAVLDRARVALVSGAAFGCPTHARLSFATSEERIDEGLARLRRLLET
jgi:aspartate aminotransferase